MKNDKNIPEIPQLKSSTIKVFKVEGKEEKFDLTKMSSLQLSRMIALKYWNLLSDESKIELASKYYPERSFKSLTGREIEEIYNQNKKI